MIRISAAFLLLLTGCVRADAAASQAGTFPLRVERVEAVGLQPGFGSILAVAVGPDGSVIAVDHVNSRVVAFGPDGRERWRAGRAGRGPGEFQIPYRVAVGGDGSVHVLDMGTGELSRFSAEGRYLDRARLPFPFAQVDGVLALPGGEIAISGYAPDGDAPARAIHRFAREDERLRHTGSFGALPQARDPEVLRSWGAGAIQQGTSGTIWYARRSPYEVYRFTSGGTMQRVLRPPFRSAGMPDDAVQVERNGRSTTWSAGEGEVVYPAGAVELSDGFVLVTRITAAGRWWDLFGPDGRLTASRRVPDEWGTPAGYDAARDVLWSSGTYRDEPALLRMRVVLTPTPRNAWLRGPDGTLAGLALRCTSEEGEVRAQTIPEHPAPARTVRSVGSALDPKTIPLPAA